MTKLPAKEFAEMLQYVLFAVSADPERRGLHGVYIDAKGGDTLTLIGCDGHRLAKAESKLEGVSKLGLREGQIIHLDHAKEILAAAKAYKKGDFPIEFVPPTDYAGERGVHRYRYCMANGDMIEGRCLDEQFPDWTQVIPRENPRTVTVEVKALVDMLATVKNPVGGDLPVFVLELNADKGLTVWYENKRLEETRVLGTVAVDYDGEPVEAGYNVNYLKQALAHVPTKRCHLTFYADGISTPLVIKPFEKADWLCLTLNVRR